jgi:general secretion pathway protein D
MTLFLRKILSAAMPAALLLASFQTVAADPEKVTRSIKDSIGRNVVSEQEIEARADKAMAEANDAFVKNQYKDAVDKYLEAIKLMKQISDDDNKFFKKRIDQCKEQISKAYFYWSMDISLEADKLGHAKEFKEAIELCKKAIEIYPPCKNKMEERIASFERMQKTTERRNQSSENNVVPGKDEQEYSTQVLLKQAKTLYDAKDYSGAKNKYEQILLTDPYQNEAIQGLRATNIKIEKIGAARNFNMFHETTSELEWKWATPISAENIMENKDMLDKPVSKDLPENKIQQKLKSIKIPRIDFEDVTIPTAVKYLREQSKQLDPEGVGVNIFLRLAPEGSDKKAAAAAPATRSAAPPGAPPGVPPGGAPTEAAAPAEAAAEGEDAKSEEPINSAVVNLILTNKTLGEAIHFLCQAAKLKFRVEKYAVVIASQNVPLDDLETKIYPVEQASLAAIGNGEDPELLKRHFEDRSIKFPEGAKVVYDTRISRLIATNTPENLRKIEQVISNELSSRDPMVQIQAKFVEIEQDEFKELGFEYIVSNNGATDPATANGKLQLSPNNNTLRNLDSNRNDRLFIYHRETDNFTFDGAIKALNQMNTQDVLSSPRITTLNGQQAMIKMVREVYFVDTYAQSQLTSTTSTTTNGNSTGTGYTYVSPFPTFGSATELGISLTVTPEVDVVRRTITMDMQPIVQGLSGWTEYRYTLGGAVGDLLPVQVIKKPQISQRTINTKVTIYDGETIVLGGIIKDEIATVNDKIPVLGDMPLIGRFFMSQGTSSTKTNLLVFLTCRLVKPDGAPFFPDTMVRGLPDFRKLR